MLFCPQCRTSSLRRANRTLRERLRGKLAAYRCVDCGARQVVQAVKHCWRCGTDLDRRKRQHPGDYLAAILALWPYSCRRCGVRRYRWGKESG